MRWVVLAIVTATLRERILFEVGNGDTWEGASRHDYLELDMKQVLDFAESSRTML